MAGAASGVNDQPEEDASELIFPKGILCDACVLRKVVLSLKLHGNLCGLLAVFRENIILTLKRFQLQAQLVEQN